MVSHISRVKVGWGKGECWGLGEPYLKSSVMTWPWCYLVWNDVESWFFPLWMQFMDFLEILPLETSDGPSCNREPGPTPLLSSSCKSHPHSLHVTVHFQPFLLSFSCSWQFSWVGSFLKWPSKALIHIHPRLWDISLFTLKSQRQDKFSFLWSSTLLLTSFPSFLAEGLM